MSPKLLTILGGSNRERALLRELAELEALRIEPATDVGQGIRLLVEEVPPAVVLAGIDQRTPGFPELLATVDAMVLRIPVLATANGGILRDLPVETGPALTLLDLGRLPQDLVARVSSAISTPLGPGCLRRGVDYLLPAILSGRSISLELRSSTDRQVLVELVGGDVWNVYADLEAFAALESILFEPVSQAEVQTLQTIPGERQLHQPGVEALGPGTRRIARTGRSAREESRNLSTQEVNLRELIAESRAIPSPASGEATAACEPVAGADPVAARFEDLLSEGIEAALFRDYARAARAFEGALELRPNDPRVKHNLDRIRRHL